MCIGARPQQQRQQAQAQPVTGTPAANTATPQPAAVPTPQSAAPAVSRNSTRTSMNNTDIVGQVIGRNDNAVAPSTGLKKLMGA